MCKVDEKVENEVMKAKSYMFGGKSEFSIMNLQSGRAIRYKVRQAKDNPEMFFVRVRMDHDWIYAGCTFKKDGEVNFYKGKKGNLEKSDDAIKGLLWAAKKGDNPLPRPMVMYHHGRCACCGKKLMDVDSINRGFGPKCWEKMEGV